MTIGASGTTNLHACSEGHDWQAIELPRNMLEMSKVFMVFVVCRRCGEGRRFGTTENTAQPVLCLNCGRPWGSRRWNMVPDE